MSNDNQEQKDTIKVISESFVRPTHEDDQPHRRLYLGPFELAMLMIYPIQKGLLFTFQNQTTTSSITISKLLDKLKSSLAIALVHFYPLAGRFETQKFDGENTCTVYIDCNKGPGARLIHASAAHIATSHILSQGDIPKSVESLFDLGERLVNYDSHEYSKPLLSIQVTELLDGVFIGFTMNHSVLDGTSFMNFVSVLSEIFNSDDDTTTLKSISRVPVFNYKPWCDNPDTIVKLPYSDLGNVITRQFPAPLRERIFHFSSSSLARLKGRANEECTTHAISSFQALAALMWRVITKARNLPLDQESAYCLLMNARSRLDPPISENYFGNFLCVAQETIKVEELLGHDLGWAAKHLNERIVSQNAESISGVLRYFAKLLSEKGLSSREGDTHGRVVIGGSVRFDMYGPEFGLGKAVAVRMGFANKEDGKINANPGQEGDGSVDLEVCLKAETMAALEADQEFMSYVLLDNNW